MASRRKARILAVQTMYAWDIARSSVSDLFEFSWLDNPTLPPDTDAFVRLLVQGTLDNLPEIDAMISKKLVHWDIGRIRKVDLAILRTGVFALRYVDDIPATVTIDEAVDIAKEFGGDESYRFVNGVLDAVQHELGVRKPGNHEPIQKQGQP